MLAVMADSTPLLSEVTPSPPPEVEAAVELDGEGEGGGEFLPETIIFHGKELRVALGKSFIRKPGTQEVLVRIGVSAAGVFKIDGVEGKILEQWKFSQLKDWSFSGFSFTLKLEGGRSYSVRTDDGEAICTYIEAFKKNPKEALKRARDNPPNSKIPESGIRTLRKKFSGDSNPPSPSDQVRFYTLNRRTSKKNSDPTSKLAHNIEMDSRLRSAYAEEASTHAGADVEVDPTFFRERRRVNGVPLTLGTENKEAPHGHPPNRFDSAQKQEKSVASPTSTKGEPTRNQTTQHATHSGTGTPSKLSSSSSSSSLNQRHTPTEHSLPLPSGVAELTGMADTLTVIDSDEYFYLRPRSSSETTRPINVVKGYLIPRSATSLRKEEKERRAGGTWLRGGGSSSREGAGSPERSSRKAERPTQLQHSFALPGSRVISPSDSECSGELTPVPRTVSSLSNSSGGTFSPDLEFQAVAPKQYQAHVKQQQHLEEPKWYENSPSPSPEEEAVKPRAVSPPYDTLSRSNSESGKWEPRGDGGGSHSATVNGRGSERGDGRGSEGGSSTLEHLQILSDPTGRSTYDHLTGCWEEGRGGGGGGGGGGGMRNSLGQEVGGESNFLSVADVEVAMRRIVSQPVFGSDGGWEDGTKRVSGRSSPSPGPDSILETESDEEGSSFTSSVASEMTSDRKSGVIMRRRKDPSQNESDPFEDILSTTQAVNRLRWSQELNPLYDYIKGMRITESMSSQNTGIKLYAATTMLSLSSSSDSPKSGLSGDAVKSGPKFKKPPSIILEESESEMGSLTSPKEEENVPLIIHSEPDTDAEIQPMIFAPGGTSSLPRPPRRTHFYEEVNFAPIVPTGTNLIQPPPILRKKEGGGGGGGGGDERGGGGGRGEKVVGVSKGGGGGGVVMKPSILAALSNPAVRRLQTLEAPQERSGSISPRLGKRQLPQRRSRTLGSVDDTEAIARKQKPVRVADTMKDFSYVMREYRLFYIKMPNSKLHSEVFSISRPVSELREKLCDLLGVDIPDNYLLYVEGACLTSLRDEVGEGASHRYIGRSSSLTHINDQQWLPDQGSEPILLKPNLSFRMQGITTSRVLALMSDDVVAESKITYPAHILMGDETEEFHKSWISIVQGNVPCTQEQAVRLAAIQYQAYFLDRTALHSVVGFCRPTEFLPIECSTVRGAEQRMYKEQEKSKLKTHKEVHEAYIRLMSTLPTFDTVFFPVREPRKKMLQSTKLKPVILGVGPRGVMRVDPKTKDVLDCWDYQVLRNWAYSRKTFVLAFTDKNYPVESNQAKWLSMLVDFHVDSIISTAEKRRKRYTTKQSTSSTSL